MPKSRTCFIDRHIGPSAEEISQMLKTLGLASLEELISKTVPDSIRIQKELSFDFSSLSDKEEIDESLALNELQSIAKKNKMFRSLIGMGFTDTFTPPVILRNILENPGWYTQYTPYQPEISQGRLEALLNYQTMISELTGMDISNASMLDEGTAAAEAMMLACRVKGSDGKMKFLVSSACHPHVIDVVKTRAVPLDIEVAVCGADLKDKISKEVFAVLVQYPETDGRVASFSELADAIHKVDGLLIADSDPLALCVLESPGSWGADMACGNSQRFGVPMGGGGPHAAYLAVRDDLKRQLPGRLVGVSKDRRGKKAYRLSLQTREQHIRREKATSNICTAQVLLAVMASMYGVYHGPEGLKRIASRINRLTSTFAEGVKKAGFRIRHENYFDTLRIDVEAGRKAEIMARARDLNFNLREYSDASVGVTFDELTTQTEIATLLTAFSSKATLQGVTPSSSIPKTLERKTPFMEHSVFNSYHSETELLRYITKLQSKDLSLNVSMISLGSCTMKLNATCEMIPVSWPEFSKIHPFAPADQQQGTAEMVGGLAKMLSEVTGFPGVSLQPNAGSQGEYAGLLVIRAYYDALGQAKRNICLIPQSAHGTNPASAAMVGYKIVIVKCAEDGSVDLADLEARAEEYKDTLAAVMVTYPSTHGVFEDEIKQICETIHKNGGQVYMDGANMNAQVGHCKAAEFGVDVCHINLHKTFCIPHGGGGPGMGPICVAKHLSPYLPGHFMQKYGLPESGGEKASGAVCSAPWGSASILPIPWIYIRLMGGEGLKKATAVALLNANYVSKRLEPYFPTLYTGTKGFVAHECILDLRPMKKSSGIEAEDVAKRLMDYGFHAPTLSFPVTGTLMVEPTESESKAELDRFCEAMISIHNEAKAVELGQVDPSNNVLKNAPHTAEDLIKDEWNYPYSRAQAAYPLPYLREYKFWPSVSRIDSVYGIEISSAAVSEIRKNCRETDRSL